MAPPHTTHSLAPKLLFVWRYTFRYRPWTPCLSPPLIITRLHRPRAPLATTRTPHRETTALTGGARLLSSVLVDRHDARRPVRHQRRHRGVAHRGCGQALPQRALSLSVPPYLGPPVFPFVGVWLCECVCVYVCVKHVCPHRPTCLCRSQRRPLCSFTRPTTRSDKRRRRFHSALTNIVPLPRRW